MLSATATTAEHMHVRAYLLSPASLFSLFVLLSLFSLYLSLSFSLSQTNISFEHCRASRYRDITDEARRLRDARAHREVIHVKKEEKRLSVVCVADSRT